MVGVCNGTGNGQRNVFCPKASDLPESVTVLSREGDKNCFGRKVCHVTESVPDVSQEVLDFVRKSEILP